MAHFTRVRAPGTWAPNTTLLDTELEKFDAQLTAALNGDAGGSYTPTAQITLNGLFGLHGITLKGGGTSGSPGWSATGSSIDHNIPTTFHGIVDFDALVNVNDDMTVSGFLDIPGDVNIQSGGSFANNGSMTNFGTLTNTGSGKISGGGNSFEINNSAFLLRNPAVASTLSALPIGAVVTASSDTFVNSGNPSLRPGAISITNPIGLRTALFHVRLNANVLYSSFTIRLQGDPGTHSGIPAVYPSVSLLECQQNATFTNLGSVAVPGGTAFTTWESGVNLVLTVTPFTPVHTRNYVFSVTTESGANAVGSMLVISFRGNGAASTVGNVGELLYYHPILSHFNTINPETYVGIQFIRIS